MYINWNTFYNGIMIALWRFAMVELREITKDDYEECLKLTVADNQKKLCFINRSLFSASMGVL